MIKRFIVIMLSVVVVKSSSAQIDLNKILNVDDILGKVMHVKKGFAPKFSLGNVSIPKINKVGEIFGLKKNEQINKLFKTFKTGRTVYKIASYAGGAVALYGTIKAVDKASIAKDYKGALIGGLSTIASGLVTKFLTKGAAYKATDIFNGVVKKKIKNIFSIQPASQTMGMGLYVKL
ncbi:hypothetical protein ACQ33O_06655 [Ferruginibacter sp. SUN002]|uniref:hypothetical protein n=1 Tax=Ferruginibacter sp. SUN002 TaxID=2937789 RepID=UPI003D364CE6